MWFKLLSGSLTDTGKEGLYLFITVPLESMGRGATLSVSPVDKSGAHLAIDCPFTGVHPDSVSTQPHQHQAYMVVTAQL